MLYIYTLVKIVITYMVYIYIYICINLFITTLKNNKLFINTLKNDEICLLLLLKLMKYLITHIK